MSLELAAQHLASRGRKGDSMLVHMAPEEVRGLQALARAGGGTLTLNPDTGLPEANFLKRMLPMIIGAGLAATGVGAPLAAAMVGGGYGVAKGSLKEGLMAGLSAYGGAGLAGGLSAAAGTAAPGAVAAPVEGLAGTVAPAESLAGAASQGAGVSVTPFGAEAANLSQTGPNLFGGQPYFGPGQGAEAMNIGLPPAAPPVAIAPTVTPPPAAMPADFGAVETVTPPQGAFSRMKSGLQALSTPEGREAFIGKAASKGVEATGVGGYGGLAKYGAAALSPVLMGEEPEQYKGSGPNPYEYSYDYRTGSYTRQAPGYRNKQTVTPPRAMAAGGSIEEMSNQNRMDTMMVNGGQMFAAGGQINLQGTIDMGGGGGGGQFGQANANGYQAAGSGGSLFSGGFGMPGGIDPNAVAADPQGFQRWQQMAQQQEQRMPGSTSFGGFGGQRFADGGMASMARGGISHLGDYSDGGRLLKGPGDGVSDSIPATIANKRPARLADGEFVVPARIVSELGNGSTEAGARKLYAMMDRVQKARKKSIGKNRVAVNSRAEKLLPA